MQKIPALHPTVRAWLLAGPLAAYVPAYVARLERGNYAATTVARCLGAVAHFAHWMSMCRLTVGRLDESRIDQFLHDHLPHCGCPAAVAHFAHWMSMCRLTVGRLDERRMDQVLHDHL